MPKTPASPASPGGTGTENVKPIRPDVEPMPNSTPPPSVPEPTISDGDEPYTIAWPSKGVTFIIDRIVESRDEVSAELVVQVGERIIHWSRLNIMAERSKNEVANKLARRAEGLDWTGMLESVVFLTAKRWREGSPPTKIAALDREALLNRSLYALYPYMAAEGCTIEFGPGGAGKTSKQIRMGIALATNKPYFGQPRLGRPLNVLFLDWENPNPAPFLRRAIATCQALGCELPDNIYWKGMTASLYSSRQGLRLLCNLLEIDVIFVDALAGASGGALTDEETASKLQSAANYIGRPWHAITHVNKEDAEKLATSDANNYVSPFGSIFHYNWARMVWGMHGIQDPNDPHVRIVMLSMEKFNEGAFVPKQAFRVRYVMAEDGEHYTEIHFDRTDVSDTPLEAGLPDNERILGFLKGGAAGVDEIATHLNRPLQGVAKKVDELERQQKVVRLPDKRVGLASVQHEDHHPRPSAPRVAEIVLGDDALDDPAV